MIRPYPNSSFFPKPRKKNTSGNTGASAPATKKQINSFEQEYQKFIAELKAKKAAEEAKKEETPVLTEEPKVEAEVIPETVTTVAEDAPILNEETQPKKTKKKKAEPVVEPTIDGLD